MKTFSSSVEAKKAKQIKGMKRIFFCSILLLFANIFISSAVPFQWPKILGTLFSLGVWWGGLGWLWQKFRFRKASDL